ncbi:MAG: Jag N-terminal domain-containing protein [Caldilineaceae bacterium]|nr:Jag N-terminal domain-containing protein [Caldilineaceae bacterium]
MSEQSQEFSAKSVEAAIEDGLRHLGVSRDRVDVEVLHEGSRGLLGIGSTNARVRLTLRSAPTPAAKSTPAPVKAPPVTPPAAVPAAAPPTVESQPAPVAAVSDSAQDSERDDEPADSALGAVEDEQNGDNDGADDSDNDGDSYEDAAEIDEDEVVALAEGILLEMVSLMGLDAQVESGLRQEPDEDSAAIYLNLVGDDLGSLIGRHGETLSSMQYLVRLMVNQKLHRWTNIVVDVEGYKDRRAEKLAQMALRMADQVIETGRPVALEPMPANERRLIHIALRNHPQVYTESIGEDTRRKIQILLK